MNAYELAKAQQAYSPPTLEEIIKQQADRIAELEKQLEEKNKPPTKPDTLMESQARKFWGSLDNQCHGYTTPQTKPLSDEEIDEILESLDVYIDTHAGVKLFARAIEAKVRGQ